MVNYPRGFRSTYRAGRRHDIQGDVGDALIAARGETNAFVWIDLSGPSAAELADVAAEFSLHPLAVEDAIHAHQRPKIDIYDKTVLFVIKSVRYGGVDARVSVGEVMVFIGEGFALTVRHGFAAETRAINDVVTRFDADPQLHGGGPIGVLYAVADHVVDGYVTELDQLERDVEEIEQRVFSVARTNDAERIYHLKRAAIALRHAVHPLVDPLRKLAEGTVPHSTDMIRPFFGDVLDHATRVSERVDGLSDLLVSILQANLAQISIRQNDDMRRISAWVAIAAVPTTVGAIYGMNFTFMPELHWRYGYPIAVMVIVVGAVTLRSIFKRSGWL
jgi:magnesium transporter